MDGRTRCPVCMAGSDQHALGSAYSAFEALLPREQISAYSTVSLGNAYDALSPDEVNALLLRGTMYSIVDPDSGLFIFHASR